MHFSKAFKGLDHGVGHPLLLPWNAKAPNHRKNKAFKDLAAYSKWLKGADAVIKTQKETWYNKTLGLDHGVGDTNCGGTEAKAPQSCSGKAFKDFDRPLAWQTAADTGTEAVRYIITERQRNEL